MRNIRKKSYFIVSIFISLIFLYLGFTLNKPIIKAINLPKGSLQPRLASPVTIGPGDSQNFFAPIGVAKVNVNDDGTWDTISLNENKKFQVGAVALNSTIDMTKDFNFSWNLKIDPAEDSGLGDGIGFVFHPLYKPGETVNDTTGAAPYTLPSVFGRHADGSSVIDPTDPDNGQNIHSLGFSASSFGIDDLMNALGFKIDTYYNNNNPYQQMPGTPYGDANHTMFNYVYPDDYYPSTGSGLQTDNSYGAFVSTDGTGFALPSQYSAPLNGLDVTAKSDSFGSVNGTKIKIADSAWRPMTISYTASTYTMIVTLGDPTLGQSITWTKVLNPQEQAIIAERHNWAFAILGSTGGNYEGNTIKNLRATFTPGEPVITTRCVDENGNDLIDPKTTLQSNWQADHGNLTFVDQNNQPTINKDGKIYRRAQVNGTYFENGTKINKRLGSAGSGAVVNTDGDEMTVTTQFGNVTFINYVYRQEISSSNLGIDCQMSVNGGPFSSNVSVKKDDTIVFKYSATNNSVPGVWKNVTAFQPYSERFRVQQMPPGASYNGYSIYIPLNSGATNNLLPGQTGSNTLTMIYQGKNDRFPGMPGMDDRNDQITVTTTPGSADDPESTNIAFNISIYDQSNQLIDDSGNPIYGSYFFDSNNNKAPLMNNDQMYQTGNYVPNTTSSVTDSNWWYIDSSNTLHIYRHDLDIIPTSRADWPWALDYTRIQKIIIHPGFKVKSLKWIFSSIQQLSDVTGLENIDTSEVTDFSYMFDNCPNLFAIDLSKLDMRTALLSDHIFDNDIGLERITLGPKNRFPTTDRTLMDPISSPGTTRKWQAIASGTAANPQGATFTTANLLAKYANGAEKETYVWEPTWWDYDDLNQVLTIHAHMLNLVNDSPNNSENWPWYQYYYRVKKVVIDPGVAATGSLHNFFGAVSRELTSIEGLDNLDTSEVTDMSDLFNGCIYVEHIDTHNFNTSKVTNMKGMFSSCRSETELDLRNFDTSNVTDMSMMFYYSPSFKKIDVSSFNTSKVTTMSLMFSTCYGLEDLDVSGFDTKNVIWMNEMFGSCKELKQIDVSHFDTSKVINMFLMFENCVKLESLDLRSFDTANVTDMGFMFAADLEIKSIKFSDKFVTDKVTNMYSMFGYCTKLTELDLHNFDTRNVTYYTGPGVSKGVGQMFDHDAMLWKLTLGPNTKLNMYAGQNWGSILLPNPAPGDLIKDSEHPAAHFYCTAANWREVGSGSDHSPLGDVKTAADISAESMTRTDTRTYVWEQNGGALTITNSNDQIDFGTKLLKDQTASYTSNEQNLTVSDTRSYHDNKTWRVEAQAEPLASVDDPTRIIRGNPLWYQDASNLYNLNSPVIIDQGTSNGNDYEYSKTIPWNLLLKVQRLDIPGGGRYNSNVIFTLIDTSGI